MTSDPGELLARYLEANPLPDDAQYDMTTDELAELLGVDQPDTPSSKGERT